MHECPECGQMRDCDGEDMYGDAYNCTHECEEYDDEQPDDFDDADAERAMDTEA